MKTAACAALVAILLIASIAGAEEERVTFAFDGATLKEATQFLKMLKGIDIDVAEELAKVVISLKVTDLEIGAALDLMGKLADPNGKVEKLSDRHYRIFVEKPKADWKAVLGKKIDSTKVNINFADTSIKDALHFLGSFAEVNIVIDPAIAEKKSEEELLVTLQADDIAVKNVFELITLTKGLAWDLRWGVVFVSLPERLQKLPNAKPEFDYDPANAKLLAAFEKPVTFSFDRASVTEVLNYLKTIMGVNTVIDDVLLAEAEKTLVTAAVSGVSLLDALQLILLPRDFPFRLLDGVIFVTRATDEKPAGPPGATENGLPDMQRSFNFENTPVEEVLGLLSELGSVAIQLDPQVTASRKPDELLVNLRADRLRLNDCLALVTITKGLASDVRWGGIFVSTPERLKALPKVVLSEAKADAPEWEKNLRASLAAPIAFSFGAASVDSALSFIATVKNLNIVTDPKAAPQAEEATLTMSVSSVTVADALAAILLPRGLTFELKNEVVLVKLR